MKKYSVKCDKDLLELLQKTEKEHIDFLVDVLTDEGQGRVALSSSIKDLLIDDMENADHYSEEALSHLLHEFQQFGGSSGMNFFRSDPLSYETLLTDVFEKLNGENSITKQSTQKESEIVLGLFGEEWRTMPPRQRWERATEIKVISGFFDLKGNLSFSDLKTAAGLAAAAVLLRRGAIAPAALAFAVHPIYQPAYRLTIPFVSQIAYIKMLNQVHVDSFKGSN